LGLITEKFSVRTSHPPGGSTCEDRVLCTPCNRLSHRPVL